MDCVVIVGTPLKENGRGKAYALSVPFVHNVKEHWRHGAGVPGNRRAGLAPDNNQMVFGRMDYKGSAEMILKKVSGGRSAARSLFGMPRPSRWSKPLP